MMFWWRFLWWWVHACKVTMLISDDVNDDKVLYERKHLLSHTFMHSWVFVLGYFYIQSRELRILLYSVTRFRIQLYPVTILVPHACRVMSRALHALRYVSYVTWWICENCYLVNYVTWLFMWLVNNVNLCGLVFLQYIWLVMLVHLNWCC
jgi:hypothetical protein